MTSKATWRQCGFIYKLRTTNLFIFVHSIDLQIKIQITLNVYGLRLNQKLYNKHRASPPIVILAGDYPHINWEQHSAPSYREGCVLINLLDDFHLQQMISTPLVSHRCHLYWICSSALTQLYSLTVLLVENSLITAC